jgi:AmmeMemoRadiSam system protein B
MEAGGMGRGTSGGRWWLTLSALIVLAASPGRGSDLVRPSALAGGWYPSDPETLAAYVDAALGTADPCRPCGEIRALVVPHAGYRYSGATAAAAFALVRGRSFKRVLLLAPSHRSPFHGLSIADVTAYETPLGRVPLDREVVAGLRASPLVSADPMAHTAEHAIEIELPMLQRALAPGWRLLPILVGRMEATDYQAAADLLRPLADSETLLVVSSDFTHYGPRFGYLPFPLNEDTPDNIRSLDEGALQRIHALDATALLDYQARTGVTICGYRALALLLALLPAGAEVHRIAYATSGGMTGDFRNSVSYLGLVATSPPKASRPPGAGNPSGVSGPAAVRDGG